MTSLHQLTAAYSQLAVLVDDPDQDTQKIETYLNECEGELREKATNIGKFIQNLEATTDAIKAAEARMAERRKAIENRIKNVKHYILKNMQNSGILKIEAPEFIIAIRNSPASVIIDDELAIPIQYLRQPEPPEPSPDKKATLADINEGVVVPGCHVEKGQYLVIK